MIALKLAYRNLVGAGLRTWLNVFVLSLSFVIVIYLQGLVDGWKRQAFRDTMAWEIGGGQYWHEAYDPYDPFTLDDSHGPVPVGLYQSVREGKVTPILMTQATIYPEGRMRSILLKGIDPRQSILRIPSRVLETEMDEIPAVIGTRMAKSTQLNVGDIVTVRWRDKDGTFDAAEAKIVQIMKTTVAFVDQSQFWIPLKRLQNMLQTPDHATIFVLDRNADAVLPVAGWSFRNSDLLLKPITDLVRTRNVAASVLYFLLLCLALVAIFDTQVISIFRRQKEIGTHMALGMTRSQVVRLFTIEGAMHGILAALLAAVYGVPLLTLGAMKGLALPQAVNNFGVTIADKIFPAYSIGLIVGTTLFIMMAVTVVSFAPTRRITGMRPTDAIRGKNNY
jgi:putative ABC transport system permease protein